MTLSTRSIFACTLAAVTVMPASTAAQQSRGIARAGGPAALGIHGFSVVLVVGSLTGAPASAANDGVPDAARKALNDMKEFLPFKRYQLLDAAWTLCCASPRAGVSGLVRGPDERDYRYEVDPLGGSDSRLDVRFTIREMRTLLQARPAERPGSLSADHPRNIAARRNAAQGQGAPGVNVIDSTFSISLGETVVVGTSRLHGDRALIAILTAAGKPAAPRGR
ncbi:MAG TPA: hypothetical protein VFK57_24475 [Vicinamibacterales bacterium]|nr:hypothetical protein [Vicinamibacterales bacterium]